MNNLKKILETKEENYGDLLRELISKMEIEQYFCPTTKKMKSTNKFLSKKTKLVTGYADFVLDDENAYFLLFKKIKENGFLLNNKNFSDEQICKFVQNSVFDYFGIGTPSDEQRTRIYRDAFQKEKDVSIKDFRESGNSMCLERASLSHNYFLLMGFNAELVAENVLLNSQRDLHTFNVVSLNDGKYIFDLVASKIKDAQMPSPIMTNLSNGYLGENISFTSQSGKINFINYPIENFIENTPNL